MTKNKKIQVGKKSNLKSENEVEKEYKPYYLNYVFGFLLLAIFVLSLYLRTVMPYDSVFRNGVVAFASDDAVFQMRLVENNLYNFPHRITFDPFTNYPFGGTMHWGPLWTQLISFVSLFVGLGNYNMQTVNFIGAIMPSVFGALVVFPVYFIGKQIGNRFTGLIAAFMISVLPGQFFSRSTLGFTDNHVAEVFFSTATIAFLIYALKSGWIRNITFSQVSLKEKSVIYSIFAGVMLAAYQLSWPGAPFFAMIILIFILIQYIIDDMRGSSTDYLAIATVPMFFVSLLFVLPYVHPGIGFARDQYSSFHVAVYLGGMVFPIMLSVISREVKKRGYSSYYYPISLGGFFVLGMLLMKIILPQMYSSIVSAPSLIYAFPTGGLSTVAEATSILDRPGMLWSNFPITGTFHNDNSVLLFIIIAMLAIGYGIVRKQRPEYMLILVWSIVMLLATFGQNRWAYYFAVNAALLVGYAGAALLESILKSGGWSWEINKENISYSHVFSLIIAILLLLFFAYPVFSETYTQNSKYGGGEPSGGGFSEWLETLTWMRYNTPDPGLDYLAIYKKPVTDGIGFPYPKTAYGIMSWWDYGHTITYWAHRIPNANPFQAGIGGGTKHLPGAATFLTAKTEEEADNVLYALGINGKPGSRYVVSNAYMAYQIMGVFGIWNEEYDYYTQVRTREGMQTVPSLKYYENMEAKLHIFDGNNLKRYRLVHESARNPYGDEQSYKNIYNVLYKGNIPVENSGLVKVFEFVKGAKIMGRAPPDGTVTISNTIQTNIGRTVQYKQVTSSNGTYELVVPYSTLGPISGETQFDTKPTGAYTVTAGNISKQVEISEKDVLEGGTVTLDLV